MLKRRQAREHAQNITEFAPAFETAISGFGDVCGEAESEQIEEIKFALRVAETDDVAGAAAIFLQRCDGMFYAARSEILQEGIAGAEREEAQGGAVVVRGVREKSVDDFEGGAITADGEEIADSFAVSLAGDFGGVACACGALYGQINSGLANSLQHRFGELPGFATAGCGIHDREKLFAHWRERSGIEMVLWVTAAPRRSDRDFGGFARPSRRVLFLRRR